MTARKKPSHARRDPERPPLSVVIPVYNAAATLEHTLSALQEAIPAGAEVLVVDDASTDASMAIARQFPFEVLSLPRNRGTSAARNTGWRAARSDRIAFVDADVVVGAGALSRMARTLDQEPQTLGVNGIFGLAPCPPGLISSYVNTSIHFQHLCHGQRVSSAFTAICILRREALEQMGGWDERWFSRYADDVVSRFRLPPSSLRMDPQAQVTHLKAVQLSGLLRHRFNIGYFFPRSILANLAAIPEKWDLLWLASRYPLNTLAAAGLVGCIGLALISGPLSAPLLILPLAITVGANAQFFRFTLKQHGLKMASLVFPLSLMEGFCYLAGMTHSALHLAGIAPQKETGGRPSGTSPPHAETPSGLSPPPSGRLSLSYLRQGLESLVLARKPMFLTVFVTARCSLNCGHCFYRQERNRARPEDELTLEEFDLLTRRMSSCPKLILTGGEPFLRRDLPQIAALFHDNASQARQITIPTAGFHTRRIEALVTELLPSRPDLILEIQLSIDGVGERHDRIRGEGTFKRLMATYEVLGSLARLHPGLRIRFNFTFSRVTQHWFTETFRFVTEDLGHPQLDMVLLRYTSAEERFWGEVDLERYGEAAALLQQLEMRRARGSLLARLLAQRPRLEREIIAKHHSGEQRLSGCKAGTLTAVISETGEVKPCEMLDTCFGQLRDRQYDLEAIWRGPQARAHRQQVRQSGCFCTFETGVRTTLSFQPKWYLKMTARLAKEWQRGGVPVG